MVREGVRPSTGNWPWLALRALRGAPGGGAPPIYIYIAGKKSVEIFLVNRVCRVTIHDYGGRRSPITCPRLTRGETSYYL